MPDPTAVIYCRVSTARQAEDELPLASQEQRCADKAAALGATVLRVYRDEGRSGQSEDRAAFQAAILFCETHAPAYLITWNTARFARNRLDAQLYKRRLARAGVALVYAGLDIDRDSDGGWLTEGILELFDEYACKQIAADTRRSMIKAAQGGYWCGGRAPLGYRAAPDPSDPRRKRLTVVEEEAAIVRRVFGLRAEGLGSRAIAVALNAEGLINRRSRWNKSSVLGLLRNSAVLGQVIFGRMARIGGTRQAVAESDWIVVAAHPPLIERETWERVQRLLDADAANCRSDAGGSPHSTHLFTGLLRCGRCGARLQIETAKGRSQRYRYYNCRTAQRRGDCPPRRIPARELDDWLVTLLCREVLTPFNLRQAFGELRAQQAGWEADRAARRAATVGRIADIERRAGKLYEVLEELGRAAPNLADLSARLRDHAAERERLGALLHEIDAEAPPTVEFADLDMVSLAADLTDMLRSGYNPARIRAFCGEFISRITVEEHLIKMEYDPRRLIGDRSATSDRAVPSKRDWLPERAPPGTVLSRPLPAHLLPRRAHG